MARITVLLTVLMTVAYLLGGFKLLMTELREMRERKRLTGRWLLLLPLFLFVPDFAEAACTGASPNWTIEYTGVAATDEAAVRNCLTRTDLQHNDTVTFQAGTFTITNAGGSNPGITITKGIRLLGSGTCAVDSYGRVNDATSCPTIIHDEVPHNPTACGSNKGPMFRFNVDTPNTFELGQLVIVNALIEPASCAGGPLEVTGSQQGFRVHHLYVDKTAQTKGVLVVNILGGVTGLFDHIKMACNDCQFAQVNHPQWGGVAFDQGDNSYATAVNPGSSEMVYFEDNTLSDGTGSQHGIVDCQRAGRFVVRYNRTTNYAVPSSHGAEGGGGARRGCRWIESYENDETWTAVNSPDRAAEIRGGSGVFFNNRVTVPVGLNSMLKFQIQRDFVADADWAGGGSGKCDGSSGYDGNTGGGAGYPCVDQPGRGTSNALTRGGSPSPAPLAWVGNALEPIYVWGNTLNGTSNNTVNLGSGTLAAHGQQNRDWYNDGTERPGYTPYTYPHPLQGSIAPPPPTKLYLHFAEVTVFLAGLLWKVRGPLLTGCVVVGSLGLSAYQHAQQVLPEYTQRTVYQARVVAAKAILAVLPRKE